MSASAEDTSTLRTPNTMIAGPCQAVLVQSESIRREGYVAMEKAYQVNDEADETFTSAFESRRELESLLVVIVTLMKSQT